MGVVRGWVVGGTWVGYQSMLWGVVVGGPWWRRAVARPPRWAPAIWLHRLWAGPL